MLKKQLLVIIAFTALALTTGWPAISAGPPETPRTEAAATPPADDDGHQPRNPLIRGLSDLLQSSEIIEDKTGLGESLIEADAILSRVKAENKRALRDVNRQVRFRGPRSPNIVLIVAAGLSPCDLGCYGHSEIETPNIDTMSGRGVRFTDFYAGSPERATSRLSLITGLMPAHAGNGTAAAFKLDEAQFTLPEVLWEAGYSTGLVGVWGVPASSDDDLPNHHGYEEWFGLLNDAAAADAFPESLWSNTTRARLAANADGKAGAYLYDVLLQQAASYLDRHAPERPFFLLIALPQHDPTPELWKDTPFDKAGWTDAQKSRASQIARLDSDVGAILEHLDRLEIAGNTLVLLTGDSPSYDTTAVETAATARALRVDECPLYEGGIRVPLIVRWPGRVAEGTVVRDPCGVWDILPTLVKVVSAIRRPPQARGVSLIPAMRGETLPDRGLLYWESETGGFAQAVRLGKWKGVRRAGSNKIELYDVEGDLGETIDVAGEHPDIIARIQRPAPQRGAN